MRFGRTTLFSALLLTSIVPAFASRHARRGPTSGHLLSKHAATKKTVAARKSTGQRVIDTQRTTQIQSALIRQGYLSGEPSGNWDASTQAALQKLQSDNGWQTKFVPDSRAIIKLGLGPNPTTSENISASPSPGSAHEAEAETILAQQ